MWDFLKELLVTIRMFFIWLFRRKKHLQEDIVIGNKIERILKKLCEETNADRAYVFQFHNGQYFYTGNSIDKMTNTHEYSVYGISREQLQARDMMTSPFRKFLEKMFEEKIYTISNTMLMDDYNTKMLMAERGTKSLSVFLLRDTHGKALGFIGLDYVRDITDISEYSKNILKQAAEAVYELLLFGRTTKKGTFDGKQE